MQIVSLLPSATEIVCLLGLEDQLVGVTTGTSMRPAPLPRSPTIDYQAKHQPDLDQPEAKEGHRRRAEDRLGRP